MNIQHKIYYKNRQISLISESCQSAYKGKQKDHKYFSTYDRNKNIKCYTYCPVLEETFFKGQLLKDAIYDYYIVDIFQKVFTFKNELSLCMLSLIAEHCI